MKRLYIAMYHYVRDLRNSRYPGIKGLDYQLFKEQLQFFIQRFHPVDRKSTRLNSSHE